uniref:Uncharacterized protein n=1 Tax=Wuchereria bancrofti TaxID=6293 RepID=A0AAF5Q776_WUCBA
MPFQYQQLLLFSSSGNVISLRLNLEVNFFYRIKRYYVVLRNKSIVF